jgi:hypothetical protein
MKRELRFSVFGKRIGIVVEGGNRTAYLLGEDGKRRPAEFSIPDFLAEDELCQYLADLYHESATPTNRDVYRID